MFYVHISEPISHFHYLRFKLTQRVSQGRRVRLKEINSRKRHIIYLYAASI